MTWLLIIFLHGNGVDVISTTTFEACVIRSTLVLHSDQVRMTMCTRGIDGRDV